MSVSDWIILAVLTLANTWATWWISLRQKRYHGIFRFISFECIFIMVVFQYPVWFREAFAWYQVISWVLLALSLIVAIFGFHLLYRMGKPADQLEETTQLIDAGLFRYIRHPLYLALVLGGFGVMMKDPDWVAVVLAGINLAALYATARVEEVEMIRKFGEEYKTYMKKTRMFIPFIF